MYLCDRDIRELLGDLGFQAEEGAQAFNPVDQVQPASVDLRLSCVFWRPLKRFTLDLRRSKLLEIQPRRYYRRTEVKQGETISIAPGELLLGRTLEEFTIPNGYAAELTGRSSFSRLGLMVTVSGGFINPGWRGRMPIQLVNFSPNSIRLVAGIPICQIRIVRLTDNADRSYGLPELNSKYMNDDGGPSYWWRDKRIKELHNVLAERDVEAKIQESLDQVIGIMEPEIVERLERFVGRLRVEDLQNADTVLDRFAEKEDRRRVVRRWTINLCRASFTLGITLSLWIANKTPIRWWHYAVWTFAAALFGISVYAARTEVGEHLGAKELRDRRALIGNSEKA
jgi:deoxycytidine triphosphate deaminase